MAENYLVGLGKPAPSDAERDAVHIAVIPVVVEEDVFPGQRLRVAALTALPSPTGNAIADPWLSGKVPAGTRVWAFMDPNTITNLRHHWTHPSVPDVQVVSGTPNIGDESLAERLGVAGIRGTMLVHPVAVQLAREWLMENICEDTGLHVDAVLEDAAKHRETGAFWTEQGGDDGSEGRRTVPVALYQPENVTRFWQCVDLINGTVHAPLDTVPYICCT